MLGVWGGLVRGGLVRLESAVDGAVLWRRVGEVGAALPAGLGEDSVEEAGGSVRGHHRGSLCLGGPVVSQRSPDAVFAQQLGSGATAAAGHRVVRF